MSFEWQTENDRDWEQMPAQSEPKQPSKWLRLLPAFLLIVAILGFGTVTIYHQLGRQVAKATAQVEEEVLASHNLLQTTRQQADIELFITLLSGLNASWAEAQTELFKVGLSVDRQMLGISILTEPVAVEEIVLSPDLMEAIVTLRQPYTTTLPSGKAETIYLQQTEVFRFGDGRWLYAPPSIEFWGETIVEQGDLLTMQYPERDQALVQQLIAPIQAGLLALCQEAQTQSIGHECTDGSFPLKIIFSTDPASLLVLADTQNRQKAIGQLVLPTPTLVGLPEDVAAQQVLIKGYGQWVVSAGMNTLLAYNGTAPLLYYALTDFILADLGWQTLPPTPEQYAALRNVPISLEILIRNQSAVWSRPLQQSLEHPNWWHTYALVAFIHHQHPDISLLELTTSLFYYNHFYQWVAEYLENIVTQSNSENLTLEGDWHRFLFQQAQTFSNAAPIPFPQETLYFLCNNNSFSTLYQFDLVSQRAEAILGSGFVMPSMVALPNQQTLVLATAQITQNPPFFRLVSWNGQEEQLLGQTTEGYLYPWSVDPLERYIFLFQFTEDNQFPTPLLMKIGDACGEQGCDFIPLVGLPFWSPNGSSTAIMDFQGGLWIADEQGQNLQPVAEGLPFFHFALAWVDENSYVYGRRNVQNPQQIDLWEGSVEDGATRLLLPASTYLDMLPADLPDQAIQRILISPADPNWAFFTLNSASDNDANSLALFRVHRQTGELELLFFERDLFVSLPSHVNFSPDGNWLSLLALDTNANKSDFYLYNLSTNNFSPYPADYEVSNDWVGSFVWSADSQWLIRSNQFSLHLVAPTVDYQETIIHGIPDCQTLALMNEQ